MKMPKKLALAIAAVAIVAIVTGFIIANWRPIADTLLNTVTTTVTGQESDATIFQDGTAGSNNGGIQWSE